MGKDEMTDGVSGGGNRRGIGGCGTDASGGSFGKVLRGFTLLKDAKSQFREAESRGRG